MINLKEYYLCDLYEMSSGISTTPIQAGHGSPFVSFGCIYNNTILPEELRDMMDTSLEEQEKYSVKEGDIFITRTSETLDELAMSSVAIKDYPGATFSGFAKRLRPLQNNITYAKFMAYFLRSDYFRKIVNCKAVMTLRASFNEEIFSYIKIKLPEYEHQVKCGDFFWTIEEKIRCNKKIISELESLEKTIYDYWFLQYDFPDENGKPYKSSGGKMIWNEELMCEIPVGWEISDLSPYITIIRGVSYGENDIKYIPEDGYIPLLKSNNIQNNKLLLEDVIYVDREDVSDEQYLSNNSIFVTMSSGSIEHVGKIAIIFYDMPYCYGAFCSKIEIRQEYKCFLSLFFASDYFKRKIQTIVVGTNIKNISNTHLLNNKLAIPSENILKKFEGIITPLFNKQGEMIRENQELASLRNFLIPLLMNGQVGFKVER